MGEEPSAGPSSSPSALVIRYSLFASPFSHPARIERRLLAGAVALERALFADGVGALENPVLPRGEAGRGFSIPWSRGRRSVNWLRARSGRRRKNLRAPPETRGSRPPSRYRRARR